MILTKQGIRDLDKMVPRAAPVPINHTCRQWRWFNPPKSTSVVIDGEEEIQEAAPEIRCVICKKLWHGNEKAPVVPQVASLEKIAPGLKKIMKGKKPKDEEALTKPTLKGDLTNAHH